MLNDFFHLNGETYELDNQESFEDRLKTSNSLQNVIYKSNVLKESNGFRTLKIKDKQFTNCSFSKTIIENVRFYNCIFNDCLFIGATIKNCQFFNCRFVNVNTHGIVIEETYVNPQSFMKAVQDIKYANIAVNLFQQLMRNSKDLEQIEFRREAEFYFQLWQDKLTLNKFWNKKPYKIGFCDFITSFVPRFVFGICFGYGLRLKNFFCSFLLLFITFFFVNYIYWPHYLMQKKDVEIESFIPDSAAVVSNACYTIDVATKLIDSQIQPTSNFGMFWYTFESLISFIFLTALVTIIMNRFVR